MAENGKELPKVLKVNADLHRRLKRHAEKHGRVLEFQTELWLEMALRLSREEDARLQDEKNGVRSTGSAK
jgi:hypothetical protein